MLSILDGVIENKQMFNLYSNVNKKQLNVYMMVSSAAILCIYN